MSDSLYKKLYSIENLDLAWMRLKTAQNVQYKNYYRSLFLAYEMSKTENLAKLSERIKGKSYKPSVIERFYLPKSTGLSRPISFLCLDDMIVYQAYANLLAVKFSEKRKNVEGVNVFSNIINRKRDKELFFFNKWQEGYADFRSAIKKYFRSRNKWVGHFDIAAYYDTISHTALSRQISSRNSYQDFRSLFENSLKEWSSLKKEKVGHGIPQGPIASDLLGEIYLLPIDLALNKHKVKYVRYVDDIKIFGKNRKEVLRGVLLLDKECKERGLIPNAKKHEIIQAETEEDAIGKYTSLTHDQKHAISKNKKQTAKIFSKAFDSSNFDASRVKYILRVAPQNEDILKIVLGNLNQHPELAEDFCSFLSNFTDRKNIAKIIYRDGLFTDYEFVDGKYWGLLSLFRLNVSEKDEMLREAIKQLKGSKGKPSLRYGLYRFLASTDNLLILKWLENEPSAFIQMLAVSHINYSCRGTREYVRFFNKLMKRSHYEPALVGITQLMLSFRQKVIEQLGKPSKDSSGVLNNIMGISAGIDTVGQILSARYGIKYTEKWTCFLSTNYEHANEILFLADKSFYIDRNSWIAYTDSFNDLVTRKFIELLYARIPLAHGQKWPQIKSGSGVNIDFGGILDKNNQFSKHYPEIVDGFAKVHSRRSKTPSAHPLDKRTGALTTPIRSREQSDLHKALKKSYEKIIKEMKKYF